MKQLRKYLNFAYFQLAVERLLQTNQQRIIFKKDFTTKGDLAILAALILFSAGEMIFRAVALKEAILPPKI